MNEFGGANDICTGTKQKEYWDLQERADQSSMLNRSRGGTTESIADYEELASLLNERKKRRKGGNNLRLAILLGMYAKDGQIKANISSGDRSAFSQEKYKFLLDSPFLISNYCCTAMKKYPAHKYTKDTGRHPITAQMASESRLRTQKWLENGCNGFDLKEPVSNPMSFWTEDDALLYIRLNNIQIASVYGKVITEDEKNGQMSLFPYDPEKESTLYAFERMRLYTTGCSRTGCVFCGFGCHLEKRPNRYELIDMVSDPKIRDYCMRGGAFKNGIWMPDERGLGMWFVLQYLNIHGGFNIYIPEYERYEREYGNNHTQQFLLH